MPCLAETYADLNGEARTLCTDARFSIRPQLRCRISGNRWRMRWNGADNKTAISELHLSAGNVSTGLTCWKPGHHSYLCMTTTRVYAVTIVKWDYTVMLLLLTFIFPELLQARPGRCEWVSTVLPLYLTRQIIGHSGDESFQTTTHTSTNKEKQTNKTNQIWQGNRKYLFKSKMPF